MSFQSSSRCVDVNSGRPQSDAGYQNFKVSNQTATTKLATCEVTATVGNFTDLNATVGNITDLTVDRLTVTGPSPFEPSNIILPGLLAVPNTVSVSYVFPGAYNFGTVADSMTWTLNVPASDTRALRFNINNGTYDVMVNGTTIGGPYSTVGVNTTPTFVWEGGSMTVIITAVVVGAILGDPLII